jgi:hypothetical protein
MNNTENIIKQIESFGFKKSVIGNALNIIRRKVEYWVNVELDESITFESYQKHSSGSEVNYRLKFNNIYQFSSFASELLKFAKKEVYQ